MFYLRILEHAQNNCWQKELIEKMWRTAQIIWFLETLMRHVWVYIEQTLDWKIQISVQRSYWSRGDSWDFLGSFSLGNNQRIRRFKQNLHLRSLVILFYFYRVSHTFGHMGKKSQLSLHLISKLSETNSWEIGDHICYFSLLQGQPLFRQKQKSQFALNLICLPSRRNNRDITKMPLLYKQGHSCIHTEAKVSICFPFSLIGDFSLL